MHTVRSPKLTRGFNGFSEGGKGHGARGHTAARPAENDLPPSRGAHYIPGRRQQKDLPEIEAIFISGIILWDISGGKKGYS
jgi:hypothetical protein